MQDLRTLLYALADQLAERVQAPHHTTGPQEQLSANSEFAKACEEFVRGLAKGDLSVGVRPGLAVEQEIVLREALERVRNILQISKESASITVQRTDAIVASMETLANASNHQRTLIDRTAEDLRPVSSRLEDLSMQCAELSADSDRIALLALNTGIEGLRVGGEVARALGALGEEIRRIAQRESLVAKGVADALKMHKATVQRSTEHLDDARETLRTIVDQISTSAAAAESVRIVDEALNDAVKFFRLHDSESQLVIDQLQQLTHTLHAELGKAKALMGRNPASAEAVNTAIARIAETLQVQKP